MRIAIAGTANYPALNGQATFTENLTEALARRGHEVLSIFPSEKGKPYNTLRHGVHIETLRSNNLNFIHPESYFSLFSRRQVGRILDDFQPQVVHIQDHYPVCIDVVSAARRRGIKLIGTNHFMPENLAAYLPVVSLIKPFYRRVMWDLMLMTFNKLDAATAQSRAAAHLLKKQGLHIPIFPASCGLNLDRFFPDSGVDRVAVRSRFGLDPQAFLFLFVGRVDREKHLEVLLHAQRLLQRPGVQLAISGHGADQKRLEALVAEMGMEQSVRFTGFVPRQDLPALLNSADVFCMPSEAELLSLASLEAMACARPVLLADAVALPELAVNGENGYLFKPGDLVDAARCMTLLIDHPHDLSRMGQASLERARQHGMEATMQQYETLYAGLVEAV